MSVRGLTVSYPSSSGSHSASSPLSLSTACPRLPAPAKAATVFLELLSRDKLAKPVVQTCEQQRWKTFACSLPSSVPLS